MSESRILLPIHLDELRASAIPLDLIEDACIKSIRHAAAYDLGFRSSCPLDGMLFPYLDPRTGSYPDRYGRLKPTISAGEAKYLSPVGESPRFYFTPGTTLADLSDSANEMYLVEGEKKALAVLAWARRRGMRCVVIGLGGCYAWLRSVKGELPNGSLGKVGSEPIDDFDLIRWQNRKVTICLDGDVVSKPRVASAESSLARELRKRGARIFVTRIPAASDGRRRGADDVIAQDGDAAWDSILTGAIPRQDPESDISDLLRDSGLTDLGENPPLEKVEACLTILRHDLGRAAPLRRSLAREGAAKALRDAGFQSPTAIVDAALNANADHIDSVGLQGKALALVDPEPWPDPVDGAELLEELEMGFTRHLTLPPGGEIVLPLWDLHAHCHDAAQVSPILGFKSATKRAGKTTGLTLLGATTPRTLLASNVTAATIFRTVDRYSPTLLVDEADSFLSGNEELRGILNSGHTRTGAVVIRIVGDENEPHCFSTWCPKAIALIGNLPGTLEDRSIVLVMRRRSPTERIERLRLDRLDQFEPLRRKAARWAKDNSEALRQADPEVPPGLNDRAADNWRPLLAIADLCGGKWPEAARRAATLLSGSTDEGDTTPRVQLLADLRDLFQERAEDRLSSEQIVEVLGKMDDRPWPEWSKGKPLTKNQLARLLKPFGIRSKVIRLKDGTTPHGHFLKDLEDSFDRYLPSEPQHPQQASNCNELGPTSKRNMDPSVAPQDDGITPCKSSAVAPVALPNQQMPTGPQGSLLRGPLGPEDWEEI